MPATPPPPRHAPHDSPRDARNAAFIEAMILAASSDGSISQQELKTLLMRVLERPEFDGTSHDALNALVENSIARLAAAKSVDAVMASLRDRLPAHEQRLLGLRSRHRRRVRRRSRHPRRTRPPQDPAGRPRHQRRRGRSRRGCRRRRSPLDEILGSPNARLFTEVMVLASAVDGQVPGRKAAASSAPSSAIPRSPASPPKPPRSRRSRSPRRRRQGRPPRSPPRPRVRPLHPRPSQAGLPLRRPRRQVPRRHRQAGTPAPRHAPGLVRSRR